MLRNLYKRFKDKILYLVFGVLTTLVNFLVYTPLCNWELIPQLVRATVSNIIAWAAAVIFAYLTNKPFVFQSRDWSMRVVVPEFSKFVGCRLGSGLVETLIIFLSVDLLGGNELIMKILTSVFVVIFNYFTSKLIVFRRK